MSTAPDRDSDALPETQMLLINRLCNALEAGWQKGERPALETLLAQLGAEDRRAALRDLLPLDLEYRQQAGDAPAMADYAARFPEADPEWLASLFYSTRAVSNPGKSASSVPDKLGDYQIIGRIGGGGMGHVYKALHLRMNRVVALKVLRHEIQENPDLLQRFNREVRAAARLSHPHIVAALDAREQDGIHFLITEFVDGLDLDQIVRQGGPMTPAEAVDCILQAAKGLEYAHRQGVVHRDIKPANLLRDRGGVVKVLDMGLARIERDADTADTINTDLTDSGMVLGTVAYMAPEQARDTRRADARSDIYSLGCTLYFLLKGRPAYTGASAIDTLLSHINEPIPSLKTDDGELARLLEQTFRRMVAKRPEERFQSASELVTALEQLRARFPKDDTAVVMQRPLDFQVEAATQAIPGGVSTRLDNAQKTPESRNSPRYWRSISVGVSLLILAGIGWGSWNWLARATGERPAAPLTSSGYALDFNGRTDYVAVESLLPEAGSSYTLEVVVESRSDRLGNVLSWLGPDWLAIYQGNRQWGLGRRFEGGSHLIVTRQSLVTGEKVHLAGVFRGKDLQLFVNGDPVPTQPLTFGLTDTVGGLFIGGVPPELLPADQNQRFFTGRIHFVRITRGVRYTEKFTPTPSLQNDETTLALYDLTTGKGTTVPDLSGHGHTGTIHGAEWTLNQPSP